MAKNILNGGYTHKDPQTGTECRQGKKEGKVHVQGLLPITGIQWKNYA